MLRLVYDISSKTIKCAIANEENQIIAIKTFIPTVIQSEDGFQRSYNHNTYWNKIIELTKSTINSVKIDPRDIRYITASSIRPSCVFIDEKNDPIYIGANFDIRGFDFAEEIEELFEDAAGKSFYQATGHFPIFLFPPTRYKWFRENADTIERANEITQYLPMESWILMKFGAESHASYSSAVESGFFDLEEKFWHPAWDDILDLPDHFFPWPVQSGEIVGDVSENIQQELGLNSETELVAGLPDTQASLLGAGFIDVDLTTAVMGSTTPVQRIIDKFKINNEMNTWTTFISCKNLCENYILEANTGITGQILVWAANLFAKSNKNSLKDRFSELDRLFEKYDDLEETITIENIIEKSVFASLGPSALSSTKMSISPGIFQFNSPGGMEEINISLFSLIGSIFDNIQFAVTENINILDRIVEHSSKKYALLGGITRNQRFCQRFSDLLNSPVSISKNPESTIGGLLTLCEVAAGKIKSKSDLYNSLELKNQIKEFTPRQNRLEKMELKYNNWKKIFN